MGANIRIRYYWGRSYYVTLEEVKLIGIVKIVYLLMWLGSNSICYCIYNNQYSIDKGNSSEYSMVQLTCFLSLETSFHESSSSTANTKIKAPAVDMESALIAGNSNDPDVSKISKVRDAPSGNSYSPRCNSSMVCRYREIYLSQRNCEIMQDFPTFAAPMTTTRCFSIRKVLQSGRGVLITLANEGKRSR